MKQLFKSMFLTLKDAIWIPILDLEILLNLFARLIVAFHIWLTVLIPYLSFLFVVFIFSILIGKIPDGIWDLTRAYFYDGTFLGFTAWRVHLVYFFFGFFITFNDALTN